jgi:hypothetical protein
MKSPSDGVGRRQRPEQSQNTDRSRKISKVSDNKTIDDRSTGVNNTPRAKRGGYFSHKQARMKQR